MSKKTKDNHNTNYSTPHNISFLSYNLYCLPWLASTFSPSSCPLSSERSSRFIQSISSYDIISLQEVWDPIYTHIEKHVRSIHMHVVGSSSPSALQYLKLRVFGGGLMIISRFPMVETAEILFDKGSHSDAFVTKGVVYAKLDIGSSYVHVFNTHLQASYGYEFDHSNNPYAPIRKRQLKKLHAFVEKMTSKDNYPIMLMGDFNVNARTGPDDGRDSKEYIDMLQILASGSFQIVDILKDHNGGEHPITYAGNGVLPGQAQSVGGQRLDFMLSLKRSIGSDFEYQFLEAAVVPFKISGEVYTHISDHYGQTVAMRINVNSEGGVAETTLSHASISLGTS